MPSIVTPDAAVRLLPDRARVLTSPACATPATLLAALGRLAPERPGATVVTGMLLGPLPWLDAVAAGHLGLRTWHVSGAARRLADRGQVDYVPYRLGDIPAALPGMVDSLLVRVSPPDRSGRCSIGPSGSYTLAGLRAVKAAGGIVLAEIDPALPRTTGDTLLSVDECTAMVEADLPTSLHRPAERDEVNDRIADNVLGLLPDAPTVQLGIGAVPEAVTASLGAVRGGARLVGMAGDGVIDLLEGGALRRGREGPPVVAVEIIGTAALMAHVDRNPDVEVASSEVVHNPRWTGDIDRFVSINSALEVDLTGQVALEAAGGRSLSGLGGAVDFFEGAHRAPGGLRIVALRAADGTGTVTKIVPRLAAGTPVSLPRHAVDAVVTEHGVAWLRGASIRERIDALLAVAAPAWRDTLAAAAGAT
ncbi:hypothetical protein K6U06_09045 [Acidiferrimicrobium sp. IK]|uniref:acetyl-CoA hydrolase/transferase family protein n=1 Tax=Acidiferrimicrobium sp. IK TaxID=2871700 RepID=UPI0021CB90B1|nr:acetyl-CoA hydrolase/transferase C-terminal domain-containing protein [Acidiferrimicrobium sp. IK]MCU4184506.1 hypothetical protein [Acidiferrimicrobium sp. IK]